MPRRSLKEGRAIVTGASSGIGRALTLELARCGTDVILLARRAERLEELAGDVSAMGRCAYCIVGDVTSQSVRSAAVATAEKELGGLDILVNNAGVSAHGRYLDGTPERLRQIMEINFFAVAELIREAAPLLRQGRSPIIVNIGSILGRRAIPRNSEYCASKFALHGFSESLRAELAQVGIHLLVVAPGTTDTELFGHLIDKQGEIPWKQRRGVPPQRVARAIVRAICRGQHEIVPSWPGRLLLMANRWFPKTVDRMMTRYG